MIHTKRSVMSRRVGWGHALGCLLVFAGVARAATMHIPGNFSSIQACIDVATDGDECVVAPGTYNELINFHGKAITLRSSGGRDVTIIDAGPVPDPGTGKPVVRCDTGEGPDTVLEGFTITGGTGSIDSLYTFGGGMYNDGASPTVTDCTFTGNAASIGGGMENRNNSNPTVIDCTFHDNSALGQNGSGDGNGGGMSNSLSSPTVTNCTFTGNSARSGGGMVSGGGRPTVTNCVFSGNNGDGMYNVNGGGPTVTNCVFDGNSLSGLVNHNGVSAKVLNCAFNQNALGGISNLFSQVTVANCMFNGNTHTTKGGGMTNISGSARVSSSTFSRNSSEREGGGLYSKGGDITVINCTFSGNTSNNSGGGMFNDSTATVVDCTFSGNTSNNSGGGMFNDSTATVVNCTFNGNSAGSGGGIYVTTTNISGFHTMVTNCTFNANSATAGGGAVFNANSESTLSNCVLWGNTPDEIIDSTGATTTVNSSDVQGGWPGVGNINADPLFANADGPDGIPGTADDDLRLSPGSLGIDKGSNAELPPDVADLDGDGDTVEPIPLDLDRHARILCGLVDMGAYESGIGDDDCDQDVDLIDFGSYSMCITGPTINSLVECEPFDFNGDSHIDLADWAGFQVTFTGLP